MFDSCVHLQDRTTERENETYLWWEGEGGVGVDIKGEEYKGKQREMTGRTKLEFRATLGLGSRPVGYCSGGPADFTGL